MKVGRPVPLPPLPHDMHVTPEMGCIHYFFHCYYKMPGKRNLKKEGAQFERRHSLLWRGDVVTENRGSCSPP